MAIATATLTCATGGMAFASTPEDQDTARQHHDRGKTHYDLGEFDQAIAEFKKAYELSGAPAALFNLAQAHRLKKDYQQALHVYRSFLRLAPTTPNSSEVEQRIQEMEVKLREQEPEKPAEAAPPSDRPTSPPPAPLEPAPAALTPPTPLEARSSSGSVPPPEAHSPGSRPSRAPGFAFVGAGAALLVAGAYFGVRASMASQELTGLSRSGATWESRHDALWAGGQRSQTLAISGSVLGGAAAVTGALLLTRHF